MKVGGAGSVLLVLVGVQGSRYAASSHFVHVTL